MLVVDPLPCSHCLSSIRHQSAALCPSSPTLSGGACLGSDLAANQLLAGLLFLFSSHPILHHNIPVNSRSYSGLVGLRRVLCLLALSPGAVQMSPFFCSVPTNPPTYLTQSTVHSSTAALPARLAPLPDRAGCATSSSTPIDILVDDLLQFTRIPGNQETV